MEEEELEAEQYEAAEVEAREGRDEHTERASQSDTGSERRVLPLTL